jgi:hypothetical protein
MYLYAQPVRVRPQFRGLRGIPPGRRFRRLRGLRGLGQTEAASTLTPQQAFQQAITQTGFGPLNSRDFKNTTWLNNVYSQIQAGQFNTTWVSPNCSGIIGAGSTTDLTLTQAAGKVATGVTGAVAAAAAGTAAGVALGVATLGIGLIVSVISIIFAHHAAAVQQEQQIECTATAAANNTMNVIAEGVQSGQIAPADAATALNTLYTNYSAMVKPSFGESPYCNANCELQIVMLGMVLYWQSQYQAMATAAAASPLASSTPAAAVSSIVASIPGAAAVETAIASTGLPSWVLWAAGLFALYELVS